MIADPQELLHLYARGLMTPGELEYELIRAEAHRRADQTRWYEGLARWRDYFNRSGS